MIWQGLRTVLVGSAIGAVVALALGYVLRDRLVGVHFGDPTIYLGVPLLLLAVATLACWLPARRAARVDPLVALRAE
jgi:putative ABC transport system permease protein